jgi:hypothetical protein
MIIYIYSSSEFYFLICVITFLDDRSERNISEVTWSKSEACRRVGWFGDFIDSWIGMSVIFTDFLSIWLSSLDFTDIFVFNFKGDNSNVPRTEVSKRQKDIHHLFTRAYEAEPQNPQVLLNFGVFLVETGLNRKLVCCREKYYWMNRSFDWVLLVSFFIR